MAEVEVTRRSACGHDCAKCGGCGGLETQTLYVTAFNGVAAQVGDRVLLEGETGRVLGIAVLVYLLPVVLFFIGYAIAASLKLSEGYSMLMSFAFFAVGFVVIALVGRRHKKNPITYEITNIIGCGAESV